MIWSENQVGVSDIIDNLHFRERSERTSNLIQIQPTNKKMKVFGDLSSPETYDLLSSKSKISANKKMYYGNPSDYGLVFATWASYIIFSLYFLVVISPYFWVDSSPAITIVGICLSIPGLYNAVKCFLTGTYVSLLSIENNPPSNIQTCKSSQTQSHFHFQFWSIEPGILKRDTFIKPEIADTELKRTFINIEIFNLFTPLSLSLFLLKRLFSQILPVR